MTIANHDLGQTSVSELSQKESRELFERRCREELEVSADEFLDAHRVGSYPEAWDVAAISRLEFLLPFAQ